jgi:hypothetical protein
LLCLFLRLLGGARLWKGWNVEDHPIEAKLQAPKLEGPPESSVVVGI